MIQDYVFSVIIILLIIRIFFFMALMFSAFIITKIFLIQENRKIGELNNSLKNKKIYRSFLAKVKVFMEGFLMYAASTVGRMNSQKVRIYIYRHIFKIKIEKNVVIYNNLQIRRGYKIKIAKGAIIGDQCIIDGRNGLEIGSNVNISSGVWIWTEQHDPQSPTFGCENAGGMVKIGNRVWISSRVTILPGRTIGEGAVVAANAVVTKDIEPYSIYGGIPAKKIGQRNTKLEYEFIGEFLPFF